MSRKLGRASVVVLVLAVLGLALGFGIAQSTVVTQAEWSVYLAQGLGLDWNLPENAKSNHYLARLDWTNSVEFSASQMLQGSTAKALAGGPVVAGDAGVPGEALYEVATLRAGDYGFRVKLAGGGAVLKVEERTFDLFQPEPESQWVDLDRIPLSPGEHPISLMLSGETRADALGISPPCMLPVEPLGGWQPLQSLHFFEMAVTLAKALELEKELPELGEPITIRGEDFTRTLEYPYEEDVDTGEDEPFWLSSGGSIVTAVALFDVPETGVYSMEARYISPRPIRWNMDSCLRVVTCPVTPSQVGRRRSVALELDAGQHRIEVVLPPGAKLDRVDVQRRDGSSEEYLRIVEDEGFKLGNADEIVRRRDALRAARRLRDRFDKLASLRCEDSLIAMESTAAALALQTATSERPETPPGGAVPGAEVGSTQTPGLDGFFPPVSNDDPRVSSPVEP